MFRVVVYREFVLMVRYPVNTAGRVVMFLLLFSVVFFGGRLIAGQAIDDSLEGLVVGYYLWGMATVAYNGLANDIRSEASWGTLERHFITPYGFGTVLVAKSVAKLVRTFVTTTFLLGLLILVTGARLSFDAVTVVLVIVPTLASVMGVGLAMGGFAVLYKRVGNWIALLQFAFIGLISAPALGLGWTRALPLAQGSALLQRTMKQGTPFWQFDPGEVGTLIAVAVGWFVAGYLAFVVAQRRARRLGVLGDY
ncbi:ABC transporter permease [Halobacteriales archaeon QS_8_69_26]|nr:MAG: ABC transporter permease [Halobacteriales archaeon QS_8_69_26]